MKSVTLTAALAAGFLFGGAAVASAQAPESLERAFLRQAPRLIKLCREKGYRNVGVLKFLANRQGKQGLDDNVGTLNTLLARRLQVALILANDPRKPVGILDNASAVAARTRGANHLSKDGREALFGARYPLAWGKDEVSPDAFLTGLVEISRDLRTLTVSLLLFDRAGHQQFVAEDFRVANRAEHLTEMGESFVLRGAFDDGKTEPTAPENTVQQQILETAAKVQDDKAPHPVEQKTAPVILEVRYDGRPTIPEVRDGKAFIPEPRQGQRVELMLSRDGTAERYAVVLKVNGVNTLYKERRPDLHCTRWVLDPKTGPYLIRGFQVSEDQAEEFQVRSPEESKGLEVNYGADVGTITMTVLREARAKPVPDVTDEAAREHAVAHLNTPKEPPANFSALKAQLLLGGNRGLITEEGRTINSTIETEEFNADPRPVMALTLFYYKAGAK